MDIETYLSGFDKAEKINKGMARDYKYRCRRGREEYLLRVADGEDFAEKKKEFEHLKRLSEAGLESDHRFRKSMGYRLAYNGL